MHVLQRAARIFVSQVHLHACARAHYVTNLPERHMFANIDICTRLISFCTIKVGTCMQLKKNYTVTILYDTILIILIMFSKSCSADKCIKCQTSDMI